MFIKIGDRRFNVNHIVAYSPQDIYTKITTIDGGTWTLDGDHAERLDLYFGITERKTNDYGYPIIPDADFNIPMINENNFAQKAP